MSRLTRIVTLLFAAAQFAAPGMASVIDGATAAGGRNAAAHVESKGDRDCKPPHTADCALCHFINGTHAQAATPVSFDSARRACPARADLIAGAARDARGGLNSRAPPALLD